VAAKTGRFNKANGRRSAKHRGSTGVTKPGSPYYEYRRRVGKPNGPGQPGNKAGRNRSPA
jgi:hypothetical protein